MRTFRIFLLSVCLLICSSAYAQDLQIWLDRCAPYRDQVERILVAEGVEKDYYYLMVAESKCTLKATSDKGAQGFWQLMPSTARTYGCRDPHDLACATRSAAKYIKHLKGMFKSFDDTIAAYNQGGHNLKRNGRTLEAKGLIRRVNQLRRIDNGVKGTSKENGNVHTDASKVHGR